MKQGMSWIMLGLLTLTAAAGAARWSESLESRSRLSMLDALARRQVVALELESRLERYRRSSAAFRRMEEPEITSEKKLLRAGITQAMADLDALAPDEASRELSTRLGEQLSDLIVTASNLEPQTYSRDVYQKQKMRDIHDSIVATLAGSRERDRARSDDARSALVKAETQYNHWLALIGLGIALGLGLLLLREWLTRDRPLARLSAGVQVLSLGKSFPTHARRLKGVFGQIEDSFRELSSTVDAQRRERHQFLMAVANDLRSPLVTLQAGARLLSSQDPRVDQQQRELAADGVGRSLCRLSKCLEDLTDLIHLDRAEIKLEERVVDLRELLAGVARTFGGRGAPHPLRVSAPPGPVWVSIDPARFERVVINLYWKLMQARPQGGGVDVILERCAPSDGHGVKVTLQESNGREPSVMRANGPEQELLRHWISENGFGMKLSQRVLRAHGGSVSASGVAGSPVIVAIRLPQERVASGMSSSGGDALGNPSGSRVAAGLESSRVQPMLSEHAVNFSA